MSFNELVSTQPISLSTNQVLRKTYFLLSLTLLFSALTAYFSMKTNAQPNLIIFLVGMFGLQFLTIALRNSPWGILATFLFTGFMGYTLGPILNLFLRTYTNGMQIVMMSIGTTGLIFLGLSTYVLMTRKNFNYLGGVIAAAIIIAFIAGLGAIVFNMPALQLLVSLAFAVLASAYILYTTSEVIHGGETNYIMATVSLYVALFNLFTSLLRILGSFSGRE